MTRILSLVVLILTLAAPAGAGKRPDPPPPAGGEGFGIDAELCLDGVSDFADLGTVYNKALSQGFVLELEITLDPKGARAEQWVLQNLDSAAGFFVRYDPVLSQFDFGFRAAPGVELVLSSHPLAASATVSFVWAVLADPVAGIVYGDLFAGGLLQDAGAIPLPVVPEISGAPLLLSESPEHVIDPLRMAGCITRLTVSPI